MDDPLISYRYLDGGRVVEAQCSSAAPRIEAGVAEPLTPDDADALERYRSASPEEAAEPEFPAQEEFGEGEIIPSSPEPEGPEIDPDVDWPAGYEFAQAGGYLTVTAPDGGAVSSDTPSGKWLGREAGRRAAWRHLQGDDAGKGGFLRRAIARVREG